MAGRNKPFELNPTQTSIPRSMLSWEGIKSDIDRQKRAQQSQGRRRGAHNDGGLTPQELADPLFTMGTAAAAAAPAGLIGVGLGALDAFRGGEDPMGAAAQATAGVQDALTWQPRTERGQQNLIGAAETLGGIMQPIEDLSRYMGDKTQDATGSAGAASSTYSSSNHKDY